MRLWTIHPRYLDARGLVALWREALLARAVLAGRTRGYTAHPQLARFRSAPDPLAAINAYLVGVADEARARGYRFDRRKLRPPQRPTTLAETSGQLEAEWRHLRGKLRARAPQWLRRWRGVSLPEPHPLFRIVPGRVREWERVRQRPRIAPGGPARADTRR
jgi:hypothetical protein